jgi:hypothetical protein
MPLWKSNREGKSHVAGVIHMKSQPAASLALTADESPFIPDV